jgi:ectoine hydroxylase-related dioxygenase (phytanoyl-CoA dioxygenase family)
MHRDMLQWTRNIVTVIFYLEESTVEKGCTHVIPGTHMLPWAGSLHGLDGESWIRQADILDQAVPVPMPAGGMLAIDSMIFHAVGRNVTAETRMSLTAGFHSVDELCDLENPKVTLVRGQMSYMGNDHY